MSGLEGAAVVPPEFPEVRILRLEPGDVLLVRCGECLTDADAERLGRSVKAQFPGHQVVVMDGGAALDVLRKGGE